MRFTFITGVVLAAATTSYAAAPPRASGTPVCTYSCPAEDNSKWQLVESKVLTATSVRCAYYPTNVATSTYTCSYNTETGLLLNDNDGTFCKPTAKKTCPKPKRDNSVLEAYQRRHSGAAAPAPAAVVQRAALGKRKFLEKRA